MPDPIDWSHLRSFLAIARAGRITRAAEIEGVNHSTLSRHVTALEAAIGTRLFERHTTGFTLTAAGERLLEAADGIDSTLGRVVEDLSRERVQVSGVVRVGAPDGFGMGFLAPRLGQLADLHPDLEIHLVTMARFPSLSRREADIAIGLSRPVEGRMHARKLTDYALGLYAARAYAEARPVADRAALAGHRLIGYVDDLLFNPVLDYLPQIDRGLHTQIKCSNLIAQMKLIAASAGIGVLPKFLADADPTLVRVLPEVELTRSFWLIVHEDRKDLSRVRATCDFIAEIVAKERTRFRY
ncbi:LysR family transcriptional regulator [Methyloraptor flagellatus]|uniref:LysR family transcriptional regulator n=1 Tax=Methyloraptor flagellatus TaxID=3162530 RepID=A0AAU7XEK3_9HYPH